MFLKKNFVVAISALLFFSVPHGLFSAAMNSRVRLVPKNIAERIFVTPEETLPELVAFLVSGSADVSSKTKVMHDWICDNIAYDTDVFTEEGAGSQDYETVLKKRRAVCVGYANLFAAMCYYAKIEQKIIPGWSKGAFYPGYLRDESDHAWNAVKLGNKWQLIDITWDAGYVEGRTFIKRYTTQWLSLSPAQFIYSHLPEESRWQLLGEKEIRTGEKFVEEPYLPGLFFEYGLKFGKEEPKYTNKIGGIFSFDLLNSKGGVMTMCKLRKKDGGIVDDSVWYENIGGGKRLFVDVPDGGEYRIALAARSDGKPMNPPYFSRAEFESGVLPAARALLSKKKITAAELEKFESSYVLVEDNGRYYYADDPLDTVRINAVTKILKALERNTSNYENVATLSVRADETYGGYGDAPRFPQMFRGYDRTSLFRVSPLAGKVKRGTRQSFSVESKSFTKIAFVLGGNDFVFFGKNPKTGAFTLDFDIPQDCPDNLEVYASKDGKKFEAIISYSVY